jgi:hypothetical protein
MRHSIKIGFSKTNSSAPKDSKTLFLMVKFNNKNMGISCKIEKPTSLVSFFRIDFWESEDSEFEIIKNYSKNSYKDFQ